MPAVRFEALIFDLFDTLVHFDYLKLDEVQAAEGRLRTTSLAVYEKLRARLNPGCDFETFLREFLASARLINRMREVELREFPSRRRFEILCRRLGVATGLAPTMVDLHMEQMFGMMYLPSNKREVLARLDDQNLVLASNFDHAPTLYRALESFELAGCFQSVFISDEVGWRKPSPRFFRFLVEQTGVAPERCLFVGDDPVADVAGPASFGFRVAWLCEKDARVAPHPQADWTLRRLEEVLDLVQ